MSFKETLTLSPAGRSSGAQCVAFVRGAMVDYDERDGRQRRRHAWSGKILSRLLADEADLSWMQFFQIVAAAEEEVFNDRSGSGGGAPLIYSIKWSGGEFSVLTNLLQTHRVDYSLAWDRGSGPHVNLNGDDPEDLLSVARAMQATGTWFSFAGRPSADTPEGALQQAH